MIFARLRSFLFACVVLSVVVWPGMAAAAAPPWSHGDLKVSEDRRSIVHADGTPHAPWR